MFINKQERKIIIDTNRFLDIIEIQFTFLSKVRFDCRIGVAFGLSTLYFPQYGNLVVHYSLDFTVYKAASGGVFLRCGTPRTLRKGMPKRPRTLQAYLGHCKACLGGRGRCQACLGVAKQAYTFSVPTIYIYIWCCIILNCLYHVKNHLSPISFRLLQEIIEWDLNLGFI